MPTLRDLPAIETLMQSDYLAVIKFTARMSRIVKGSASAMRQTRSIPSGRQNHWLLKELERTLVKTDSYPFQSDRHNHSYELGRALLNKELWNDIEPLVTPDESGYDLVKGSRGQRDTAVEERLCELMRCEAVTIVNNNAAALMLVLTPSV